LEREKRRRGKSLNSRHYAEIVAELRRAGTPLPTNDIWVAAVASRNGTTVLTCDDHFERITRVGSIVNGDRLDRQGRVAACGAR